MEEPIGTEVTVEVGTMRTNLFCQMIGQTLGEEARPEEGMTPETEIDMTTETEMTEETAEWRERIPEELGDMEEMTQEGETIGTDLEIDMVQTRE